MSNRWWNSSTESWRRSCRRRALVAAVEAAQEVTPVAPVESEQRRRFAQDPRGEPGPVGDGQVPAREPGVGLDHVRGDEGVLEVEGGQVALRATRWRRGPGRSGWPSSTVVAWSAPGRARPPTAGGRRARTRPIEITPGSKQKRSRSSGDRRSHSVEQAVDAEVRLGLGVRAVELGVPEGALGLGPALFDASRQIGTLSPHRQRAEEPFRGGERRVGPLQLALHPPAPGERPFGHHDGLAVGVVQRVIGEPRTGPGRRARRSAAGSARSRPRGTRVGPAGSGPAAATAMMAATTMSTGMTSSRPLRGRPGIPAAAPARRRR